MDFRKALEWCVNNLQTKWNDKTEDDEMKNIVVFGASGDTGRYFVEYFLGNSI